jgi:hypothetical protein
MLTDSLLQKRIESEYGTDSREYEMILRHRFGTLRGLATAFYRHRDGLSSDQRRDIYEMLRSDYSSLDRGRTASVCSFPRRLLLYGGFGFFMLAGRTKAFLKPGKKPRQ